MTERTAVGADETPQRQNTLVQNLDARLKAQEKQDALQLENISNMRRRNTASGNAQSRQPSSPPQPPPVAGSSPSATVLSGRQPGHPHLHGWRNLRDFVHLTEDPLALIQPFVFRVGEHRCGMKVDCSRMTTHFISTMPIMATVVLLISVVYVYATAENVSLEDATGSQSDWASHAEIINDENQTEIIYMENPLLKRLEQQSSDNAVVPSHPSLCDLTTHTLPLETE
eukprot:SAG11_NODE_9427_length_913_cov_0.851351_1_plen_227_part_00